MLLLFCLKGEVLWRVLDVIFGEGLCRSGSGGKEQNVPLRNKLPVSWFVASLSNEPPCVKVADVPAN
jgi:hypothetical protein